MAKKKFFWLKLDKDFFTQRAIKKLRRIAGGDTYTIIYLKLLLMSMNTDGIIEYDDVPDNEFESELALEIDEDVTNLSMTIHFLVANNLATRYESKCYLREVANLVGSESESASRVRNFRAKLPKNTTKTLQCNATPLQCNAQSLQSNSDVTKCNKNVTLEKRREEKEKDKSREEVEKILSTTPSNDENLAKIYQQFQNGVGCLNPTLATKIECLFEDYGYTALSKAIDRAVEANARSIDYIRATARNIAEGKEFKKKSGSLLEAYEELYGDEE